MVTKVGAYIIRHAPHGPQLLVFAHADFPEVPLQIPGGTLEIGETVEAALHREIKEESGLRGLQVLRKLGDNRFFWEAINDEVNRHFFVLQAPVDAPDSWQHTVGGAGEDEGLLFSYYWRAAADLNLAGDLGDFLSQSFIPELYV